MERRPTASDVTEANRRLYDRIASVYDRVDSRRGSKVDHRWLDRVLEAAVESVVARTGRPAAELEFLDVGAGSGFLAARASRYVGKVTLLDVSRSMLERIALPRARRVQADCCRLPLRDESIDLVGAFATLHHLHSPAMLFAEALRVLRPGGLLYCDHDIDRSFVGRFQVPLKLYRAFFDHGRRYLRLCPEATAHDYAMSEFHGETGLPMREMAEQLGSLGFEIIDARTHWEGMGPVARVVERVGLARLLSDPSWSPVGRLIVRKPGQR